MMKITDFLTNSKIQTLSSFLLPTVQKVAKKGIYLTPYVCTERVFDRRLYMYVQQNIFEKTLKEYGSSHLYASFGTFCVQIGQLFESQ